MPLVNQFTNREQHWKSDISPPGDKKTSLSHGCLSIPIPPQSSNPPSSIQYSSSPTLLMPCEYRGDQRTRPNSAHEKKDRTKVFRPRRCVRKRTTRFFLEKWKNGLCIFYPEWTLKERERKYKARLKSLLLI